MLILVFYERPLTSMRILDDFIDDQGGGRLGDAPRPYTSWNSLPDRSEGLNNLLARILERSRQRGRHDAEVNFGSDAPVIEIGRWPTERDYPLWRVRCRVSLNPCNHR
jgi:hypothetical protein